MALSRKRRALFERFTADDDMAAAIIDSAQPGSPDCGCVTWATQHEVRQPEAIVDQQANAVEPRKERTPCCPSLFAAFESFAVPHLRKLRNATRSIQIRQRLLDQPVGVVSQTRRHAVGLARERGDFVLDRCGSIVERVDGIERRNGDVQSM